MNTSLKCYNKMAGRLSFLNVITHQRYSVFLRWWYNYCYSTERVEIHSVLGFMCNLCNISQLSLIHISVFPPYRVFKGIFFQNKDLYLRLVLKLLMLYHLQRSYIYLMFCWPCIIVYQYSKTNMMHFLFNLLRTKGLYMFWALLAHLQDSLHKRHLVYCVHVM
jgi:hypothetical protein